MSTAVMTMDNGSAVHKAAIAGIEAKPGTDRTDPRVIVHLRTGQAMLSVHDAYDQALTERTRLIEEWTG